MALFLASRLGTQALVKNGVRSLSSGADLLAGSGYVVIIITEM